MFKKTIWKIVSIHLKCDLQPVKEYCYSMCNIQIFVYSMSTKIERKSYEIKFEIKFKLEKLNKSDKMSYR